MTGLAEDRYKFRTSPLRNAALQPAFFHNGCFTRLEDAIRHHLDVSSSARLVDEEWTSVEGAVRIFGGWRFRAVDTDWHPYKQREQSELRDLWDGSFARYPHFQGHRFLLLFF